MQDVGIVAAAVGALANPQEVVPLLLDGRGERCILAEQRMVVAGGDHEALGIDEFQVRVKHLLVEPHRVDDGGDPAAGGEVHPEHIDVFVGERSPDRAAGLQGMCLLEAVVRFLLGQLLRCGHMEHPQLRQAVGRPHPQPLGPGRAVGRHREPDGERRVVLHRRSGGRDASTLEEHLRRAVEFRARDLHVDRGTLRRGGGLDPGERGLGGRRTTAAHDRGDRDEEAWQWARAHGCRPPAAAPVRRADRFAPCRHRRSRRADCPAPRVPCRRRCRGSGRRWWPDLRS